MKPAFGSKRKARKIQVDDEDDGGASNTVEVDQATSSSSTSAATSSVVRKPFKKSTLRQSINFDDLQDEDTTGDDSGSKSSLPSIKRSGSVVKKKKAASSRLSFGPGEIISGDAAEALEDEEMFTPKKGLGRRVVEKTVPYIARGDDEERPTYSKDYLDELKSSTPNSRSMALTVQEDGLGLDELEGAMVVDMETKAAYIPSEAEIREKKERRARMAREQDFISLDDDGNSGNQLSLLPRNKKPESRLVREDEDLGEGFDEFVEDGRIALGKKQERAARKKQRKEMEELINVFNDEEGSSGEDDSDAERRVAYEVAQTRAGMDGLHKPDDLEAQSSVQVPTKITPLPTLAESLRRFETTLAEMEQDMVRRQKNLADLEREKQEILAREVEVQELLKQAGARYSALTTGLDDAGMVVDAQEVVNSFANGLPDRLADRGLESFGNTPTTRPAFEDDT
ncbi:nineteen complex-related protein 2-domain-containing protein [Bisporella sp. PMI_857]|nr:nineteen complex-related protein 2-domain-containing protein [Bisporella sp. PMI_857]